MGGGGGAAIAFGAELFRSNIENGLCRRPSWCDFSCFSLGGGGPSPSSAIKLRYSSSMLLCELPPSSSFDDDGAPPWPGRLDLQSLAI